MADEIKDKKSKFKAQIEAIKRFNDNNENVDNKNSPPLFSELNVDNKVIGKKISDFDDKIKSKKLHYKNVYEDLLKDVENLFSFKKPKNQKPFDELRKDFSFNSHQTIVKQHAQDSAYDTTKDFKNIIQKTAKKILFTSDFGGLDCGVTTPITVSSISLKPNEFDFLDVLKINPTTSTGKVVYESDKNTSFVKMNKELFNLFDDPTGYTFNSVKNETIFDVNWNEGTQEFNFTNLNTNMGTIDKLLTNYYSSIEYPNPDDVMKNVMFLVLNGGGDESAVLNKQINDLNRSLTKIFSSCNASALSTDPLQANPNNQFSENDIDPESFFDFDDVEGIDLDDESLRLEKVLKFRDCGDFTIPANSEIFTDYLYFSSKNKNIIDETLKNAAKDAYNSADSGIPLANFQANIINQFILELPKAMVMSIMTPKVLLPIVIAYKLTKGSVNETLENGKTIVKRLYKFFETLIKEIYWTFINHFWNRIKKEIIIFLKDVASYIIKRYLERHLKIIRSLIKLLNLIPSGDFKNCKGIYDAILQLIALATTPIPGSALPTPGPLLHLSDLLPGYSNDRALINIAQKLETNGITTGPLYGQDNNILSFVKSIIDGHQDEMDENSFVETVLKPIVVGTPPIPLPPFILRGVGRIR